MPWPLLAQLIALYGPELALYLQSKWDKKEPPTQAEIDELRALINKSGADYFK